MPPDHVALPTPKQLRTSATELWKEAKKKQETHPVPEIGTFTLLQSRNILLDAQALVRKNNTTLPQAEPWQRRNWQDQDLLRDFMNSSLDWQKQAMPRIKRVLDGESEVAFAPTSSRAAALESASYSPSRQERTFADRSASVGLSVHIPGNQTITSMGRR